MAYRTTRKQDIKSIVKKIEKQGSIFSDKTHLDSNLVPENIQGREMHVEHLVKMLLQYREGYVSPVISVYGRSGSGKSTVVKFVCDGLDEISYRFVNLRKARTIFGAANLILGEIGQPSLKSASGLGQAVQKIEEGIVQVMKEEGKKLFVLVLDEYDTIFYDRRNKPSDFVYKLLVLEENLKALGFLVCVITISNNVLYDYDLDDRVRSRIGNTEVFFDPYKKDKVLDILRKRAGLAFVKKIDDSILVKCSEISSSEHGDVRRAIDLLRTAADLASDKGEKVAMEHVKLAHDKLERDRTELVIKYSSLHMKNLLVSLARLSYLTDQEWYATSRIYHQYQKMCVKSSPPSEPLGYRRVSELLTELENTGIIVSQSKSRGRYGYGNSHKL
ncbi:MAG TPA: AAA family ATPase, partial [Candidatus Nitrosotalea sp.]|nr:AAA family ATPase [Candidatus Nitrosotalea sp.]